MTTGLTTLRSPWLRAWPSCAAGFGGPLLGFLLARWLPFHFAMGIGFFVLWFFAGFVFAGRTVQKLKVPRWFAAALTAAAAGLCVTLLSYFFPWN